MKFKRFVTVNGLFAGNTRVSLLSTGVLRLEFLTAGKKRIVGTDKAVNCQGKSFSAASIVTKFISFFPYSARKVSECALKINGCDTRFSLLL